MTPVTLERYQIGIYLMALAAGGLWGWYNLEAAQGLEPFIAIALGGLLYATFCQVPLLHLRPAWHHRRFMTALILANFVIVPLVVWLLVHLLLSDPKLQFGVLLVLLVPCTDWFLTFTYLGQGNLHLAIAATPLLLLLQSLLLPLYLWLFTGGQWGDRLQPAAFLPAVVGLILVPLSLALVTAHWAKSQPAGQRWLRLTARLPVPLLGIVLLLVAASQVREVTWEAVQSLQPVLLIFVAYLLVAGYLTRGLGQWLQLETTANRTLTFSVGTRNSFMVLPLALALPDEWSVVVTIVVLQPLVELTGMMIYLWWVPHRLLKDPALKDPRLKDPRPL